MESEEFIGDLTVVYSVYLFIEVCTLDFMILEKLYSWHLKEKKVSL